MEELKRILAVALDREALDRLGPVVERSSLAVDSVAQASEAASVAFRARYHLVICRYPLPDVKLREFVSSLRASRSASRTASLMLLTIPEMMTEARSGVESGPCLVFSGQERIGAIGEGAAHLLQVAPRFSPRITVRVRVTIEDEVSFEGWVANLSCTGMLVTDSPMMSVGSPCAFDFTLPNGGRVRGTGKVVRHTAPRREKVTGFAVRFIDFDGDGGQALSAWCEHDG